MTLSFSTTNGLYTNCFSFFQLIHFSSLSENSFVYFLLWAAQAVVLFRKINDRHFLSWHCSPTHIKMIFHRHTNCKLVPVLGQTIILEWILIHIYTKIAIKLFFLSKNWWSTAVISLTASNCQTFVFALFQCLQFS